MTITAIPAPRRHGPADLPDWEYEAVLNSASTVMRVLLPILLRPMHYGPPLLGAVAELTQRWLRRIAEARRRHLAYQLFGPVRAAGLVGA